MQWRPGREDPTRTPVAAMGLAAAFVASSSSPPASNPENLGPLYRPGSRGARAFRMTRCIVSPVALICGRPSIRGLDTTSFQKRSWTRSRPRRREPRCRRRRRRRCRHGIPDASDASHGALRSGFQNPLFSSD